MITDTCDFSVQVKYNIKLKQFAHWPTKIECHYNINIVALAGKFHAFKI